jgi:formate C-acetyltransferase
MDKGIIFDIQRLSLHDGPGIRTTVFLKGCPLNCRWCQNPEGLRADRQLEYTESACVGCGACVKACPHGVHRLENGAHRIDRDACVLCGLCVAACIPHAIEIAGREMDVESVFAVASEDRPYYESSGGGVTLSGGEPLAQPDFCAALLERFRRDGIHTALDTSLLGPAGALDKVLPLTDLFLADIKHMDGVAHRAGTGVDNTPILENLRRVCAAGGQVIVRVPVVPGFNDSEAAMEDVASFLSGLKGIVAVELLPYHKLGEPKATRLGMPVPMADATQIPPARVRELAAAFPARGIAVRGVAARRHREPAPILTGTYAARLDTIRRRKLEHTEAKRARGARDVDDWGDIPLPKGARFDFKPETSHPKGYLLGPRDCGRNFGRLLEASPTYIDPDSSLLGGYYVTFNNYVTGWDPDAYWTHLAADQRKYGIVHGIDNNQHCAPDIAIGIELGFGGLMRKIAKFRTVNRGADAQAYYDGMTEFVRGIQQWIRNHAADARRMAASDTDSDRAARMNAAADMNERLVEAAPASFVEVLQWVAWYQMAKRVYIGGGSIGRIDKCLDPFYRRETAAGTLTDEEAVFHLACFLVKDSHYLQLGGVNEKGEDETSPVSMLVLEAAHALRIPANVAVMVHDGMDPKLMRRAVRLLFEGRTGMPRFCGLKGMVEGMVRRGFPVEVARTRVQCGCHWFGLPGREYCFNDVIKINFAKVLLAAMEEMMQQSVHGSGFSVQGETRQERDVESQGMAPGRSACARQRHNTVGGESQHAKGPSSALTPDTRNQEPSVELLWRLFLKHLDHVVGVTASGIDWHIEHQHKFYPEFALSLLSHGPIERGVDLSHGGVEYVNVGVDGSAIATAADSFAAMEQRIEREKSVTWTELYSGMNQGWWRHGRTRMLMQTVPGFGRGGTRGDFWADRISREFSRMVVAKTTPAGHMMSPGLFSWASTISMGRDTGATPDGRGNGDPLSFGANPNPGRLRGGALVPTAMSTAIAAVQPGYGNTAPFQFDVDPGMAADEEGVETCEALIRTHFALGGTLINANILDREKVLDACRNPSKYPDLVVRVTGFSAYFASLSDAFRRLVYDRIVAMEDGR